MTDKELEQLATKLTLDLGSQLDGAPEAVIARLMNGFPDILLAELREMRVINFLEEYLVDRRMAVLPMTAAM